VDIIREPKKKTGRYIWISASVVALAAITLFLRQLEPAAPTVEEATIWSDTVKRGPMLRQVRGSGNLEPKDIFFVSAMTAGRVEEILAEPGDVVDPQTTLLVLSNPDVELEALQAQRQLTVATAELNNLKGTLETSILNQQATVNRTRNQHRDAVRTLEAYNEVPEEVSQLERERVQDQVEELKARLAIEERTLELMTESRGSQISNKEAEVERLQDLADFRRNLLESMHVKAGRSGVVRELPLEHGQRVPTGQRMAVIIQPGNLRAVIRVPEVQAKDVRLGQEAEVDTRSGKVPGHVSRIDPSATGGTVTVDVQLDGELPYGARADQSIDGVITIERLEDVLYTGRPTIGQSNSQIGLFKVVDDGDYAIRVTVAIGRTSVDKVEIRQGLEEGDTVILSDMSRWDAFDRVRIRH
jgi:multidrug resistance efflux pump